MYIRIDGASEAEEVYRIPGGVRDKENYDGFFLGKKTLPSSQSEYLPGVWRDSVRRGGQLNFAPFVVSLTWMLLKSFPSGFIPR